MISDCEPLPYNQLRDWILCGRIKHTHMNETVYEYLLEQETEYGRRDSTILEFCTNGLKSYPKYKGYDDVQILWSALRNSTEDVQGDITVVSHAKLRVKRVAFIVAAVISTLILLGFAFPDFARWLLNIPADKTPTNLNGNVLVRTNDERFYGSMSEMLESEKLNILYPAKLPDGYAFTNFEVIDVGNFIEIKAYAMNPYISFEVEIGKSYQYEHDCEINRIKYSVFETGNDKHQAFWSNGIDSYRVIVDDKSIISEIIENLKES